MKKRWLLIIGALLLVITNPKPAEAAGASNEVTSDGITATFATDKETYNAGEEIHYTLTITNEKEKWQINAGNFEYSNSEGITAASEESMPVEYPVIESNGSYVIEGTLIGDEAVYGTVTSETSTFPYIPVIFVVVGVIIIILAVIAVVIHITAKKNDRSLQKKSGKKNRNKNHKKKVKDTAIIILALFLLFESIPVKAAEWEEITIRPYIKVTYANQEITLRAVLELKVLQNSVKIADEDKVTPKKITCHDPSIFKDFDGKYYIIGSFLASGFTSDLINWTSVDSEFQATFTDEVREQIRAWNKDDSSGSWNGYLWAPDIVYNTTMEKYCIYLSANGDNWKSNIVLLTADSIDGPYEYEGTIVYGGFNETTYSETDAPQILGEETIPERYVTYGVDNKKWGDMYPNCIDPCVFYDDNGELWMSYGSWSGGIFMLELDEETGLRDTNVTYETDKHSDAYFGTKIAGGAYVSGEASYIQKIGDYYYLFISYGNLEAEGGYNIRYYRSETPDGNYVDELGNTPYFDVYSFNYNQSIGIRLFGGYKWRTFTYGQVAQGHNSAFVDDDGKAYIVFHTRTSDGSEGHYVKVHQLFTNKEGWLVAAPYATSGETLDTTGIPTSEISGDYEVIIHEMDIDYANLETKRAEFITLNEDGSISGDYNGTWSVEPGTAYITIKLDGNKYSGVLLKMNIERTSVETIVFTALGTENQITIWGSKSID